MFTYSGLQVKSGKCRLLFVLTPLYVEDSDQNKHICSVINCQQVRAALAASNTGRIMLAPVPYDSLRRNPDANVYHPASRSDR